MTDMISIVDVCKTFQSAGLNPFARPKATRALDHVSLDAQAGEIVALVGRNGAGKSTLMKILCTVVTPDSGQATVNGYDAVRQAAAVRRSIGLAGGDERSFYWRLSARQNLHLFAVLQNMPLKDIKPRVDELLDRFGLADKADVAFRNFSTGMKQRLALARSIMHNPRVLLLDEPNKGLDPLLQDSLKEFLTKELVERLGMTLLVATHDLDMASAVAHRAALLDKGRLLFFGKPDGPEHLRTLLKDAAGANGDGFAMT